MLFYVMIIVLSFHTLITLIQHIDNKTQVYSRRTGGDLYLSKKKKKKKKLLSFSDFTRGPALLKAAALFNYEIESVLHQIKNRVLGYWCANHSGKTVPQISGLKRLS